MTLTLTRDRVLLAAVVALTLLLMMASAAVAQEGEATVTTIDHGEYGEILADGEGMVLYLFTEDEGSTSVCYDSCAENWPPLTVDGEPTLAAGVPGELGTTQRDDGSMQVTYNGMSLYYFAGDEGPGDANGQGIGDVWFVLQPEAAAAGGGDGAAGEGGDGDDLPDTGGSTGIYLYLGAALLAAGAVTWIYRRRAATEATN